MVLSHDGTTMYVSNWFGDSVQKFDLSDPFNPVLEDTVSVPHPNMLRLSRDDTRLYVTNSLLTPWDNDSEFGPARNDEYGIWLFEVDEGSGELRPARAGGAPWVSFENVRKKTTTGPAGPHMMLFDPSIPPAPGEH
jgi:selenium-binding protein 1